LDTLSHALWGKGLFGYRGYTRLAIFFGAMPDLFSFGIFFVVQILRGNYSYNGPPKLEIIPNWVFFNYDLFHSFIVAFLFIGIVYFFKKSIAFAMLAWPFHILLDFPFHSKEYFPTKFLWPINDFSIDGIPWSNPEVWFPNLAGIILLYIYRYKKSI
jgi:hypothetical protein|tara:strand:+ start:1051 stop:1521 length:471 start_codon:yes stop_codon:yes gene_type:complete